MMSDHSTPTPDFTRTVNAAMDAVLTALREGKPLRDALIDIVNAAMADAYARGLADAAGRR